MGASALAGVMVPLSVLVCPAKRVGVCQLDPFQVKLNEKVHSRTTSSVLGPLLHPLMCSVFGPQDEILS